MDKIGSVTTLLEGLHAVLDENEKVVLKGILDNAVTQIQMVQSHMKTIAEPTNASSLNFGSQQKGGKMENKVCCKCGKIKKFKTVATEVITELKVIQRFKAGNPESDQVLSQDRDEILSQAIRRKSQTSRPLLVGTFGLASTMQLDRHRRSISQSRSPQTHYSCSTSSSTAYNSYSEKEYTVRRRRRFSKADPSQKRMGHVRRLTNKLAGMFCRDHHEDTDASSSEEDRNARDHHLSVQKHVGNGKLHRESKRKHMPVQTRRTTKVKDKASHQQGHFRTLLKGLVSHIFGSKKSKPSSSGIRQLERALTVAPNSFCVALKNARRNLRRPGLPNKMGKARLKLGFSNKHTQLKGRHRHKK
ncbi:hypothetical protein MKX01_009819 [Papaver californicum]|nr:hypothetical protein MKX01_009819 [Papaver californicum]